jgi:hypothetical protein
VQGSPGEVLFSSHCGVGVAFTACRTPPVADDPPANGGVASPRSHYLIEPRKRKSLLKAIEPRRWRRLAYCAGGGK